MLVTWLRHFNRDTEGTVAVLFGVLLIPLVVAAGVGVDYGRAALVRATLQSAVDAAALAGASAYTSPSAQSAATALAQDYVTKSTAAMPAGVTVTSTTVTPGISGSGNNVAYTMSVSATLSVPSLFMAVVTGPMSVTASAKAQNPVVTASFDMGGFISYACDTNEIYWYIVPANGSVPDASAMNLLWSNDTQNPTTTATFDVAASAKIGFAIKNVTGARDPSLGGCNYGDNGYGSHPGDVQWLYSSLQAPSADYNIAPGGANTGTQGTYETAQDCALVVEQGTYNSSNGTWSYASVPQGSCYTTSGFSENTNTYDRYGNMTGDCSGCSSGATMATEMTNAAPSCSDLGGKSYQYDWNDMGGTFDSYNYGNDMQYDFSCSGGSGSGNGTSTSSVTLIN
ncbi:MAG: TadE/TadG family type IV pilus assembly protein [Stellaceae bacterium]